MSGSPGCFFAPEELGFLVVRTGKRWKVWREGQSVVEVFHNDDKETYTAACWATPDKSVYQGHCVVMGCLSGRVQVWDASSGELVRKAKAFEHLGGGVDCSVSAVVSVGKRNSCFAATGGVPEIMEIGLMDGLTRSSFRSGKTGVLSIVGASASADWLLTAALDAPLKVWRLPPVGADLANLKKANQRLKAPANIATALDLCCVGGKLYALCTDGTTQVEFFCVEPDKQGAPSPSTRVLSCHERIEHASLVKPAGDTDELVAIGYSASIVARWTFTADADASNRTVIPTFTFSKAELNSGIASARGFAASADIVVAHGPSARPLFSRVSPAKSKKGSPRIELLSTLGTVETGEVQKKRTAAATAVPETVSRKRPKSAALKDGTRPKQPLPSSRSELEGSQLSLAPMLRQHLRSKDSSALDKSLMLKDRAVMDTSIAELSGVEAFDLIHECAKRVLEIPTQTAVYCAWIQRIVFHHGTFLRAHPNLADSLRQFYESAQHRCTSYRHIRRIHGRIRHLIVTGKKVMDGESNDVAKPLLEYVEGDEDLDDADDEDEKENEDEDDDGDSDDEDIDFEDAFDDLSDN